MAIFDELKAENERLKAELRYLSGTVESCKRHNAELMEKLDKTELARQHWEREAVQPLYKHNGPCYPFSHVEREQLNKLKAENEGLKQRFGVYMVPQSEYNLVSIERNSLRALNDALKKENEKLKEENSRLLDSVSRLELSFSNLLAENANLKDKPEMDALRDACFPDQSLHSWRGMRETIGKLAEAEKKLADIKKILGE